MEEAFKAHLMDGFQQQLSRLQPPSLCQISITLHCSTVVELNSSHIISKLSEHASNTQTCGLLFIHRNQSLIAVCHASKRKSEKENVEMLLAGK